MKYDLILIILLTTLNAETLKSLKFKDAIVSKVTSVYDGDTFRVNIDSYPKIVGYRMSIRINGIDTPEKKGKCKKEKDLAKLARKLTKSLLKNAKIIKLKNIKRGKYFRLVADVYTDNKSIAKLLIKNNLAVPYDGGHKSKDWCK